MRFIAIILLLCSCTTTKSFVLDASQSKGNIVSYEWKVNGYYYDSSITTSINVKRIMTVQLIVTDDRGLKDTAIKMIP
jgi:PKD repeat protein